MKILIVVADTEVGGVTTSAVNFSNELTYRGHEVLFLDMSGENACADRLNEKVGLPSLKGKSTLWNISLQSVKSVSRIKKIGILALGAIKKLTIRFGLWYKLIFSEFNKSELFDVAVAFRQCAPCYSFVIDKVNAKKKIGFVHGELAYMGDISSWKKYMARFNKIAYVSNAVKEQFVKAYPELEKNACTIYNMFDVEHIIKKAQEEPTIKFKEDTINIVSVSRLTKQKQIDWILHVCKKIKEKYDNRFHWYIIGDGYWKNDLENIATELNLNNVVTFTGSIENPYPLINNATFTVLSSCGEAYGMVVIESFILQKPMVVARYEALKEIMTDGKYGLVSEQNIDDFYNLIEKMIEDNDGIRSRLQENLNEYNFTNDIAYNQFMNSIN